MVDDEDTVYAALAAGAGGATFSKAWRHCAQILDAVRRAANQETKLLMIEIELTDAKGPAWPKLLDVVMLGLFAARQRQRRVPRPAGRKRLRGRRSDEYAGRVTDHRSHPTSPALIPNGSSHSVDTDAPGAAP